MKNGRLLNIVMASITALSSLDVLPALANQVEEEYTVYTRYNLNGQVTGTISPDPDGSGPLPRQAMRNTYDPQTGLLILVEEGELSTWFDETVKPKDWSTFVVNASTAYTYDIYGRIYTQSKLDKSGDQKTLTQFSYDDKSRTECKAVRMNPAQFASVSRIAGACELGMEGDFGPDRITKYTYDNRDQVLVEQRAVGTDLAQNYVTNVYDGFLLKEMTDANGFKTTLDYDSYARLETRFYPSKIYPGQSSSTDRNEYKYDENGNVYWERKRNGAEFTFHYDNNNRMMDKDGPGTSMDVFYGYDLRGLSLYSRFSSHTGTGITNVYDGFGNLKESHNTTAGSSRTLSYRYDANGNRTYIYHPDNKFFKYHFDQLNRVTSVNASSESASVISLSYRADGRRNEIHRNSTQTGAVTSYDFDDLGRLQSFTQNLVGKTADFTNNFSYLPSSQIASASYSNDLYHYFGNENQTGSYAVNGLNQYTNVDGAEVSYDDNQNLKSFDGQNFIYDDENRLTQVSGSSMASFVYDPLGRLFETIINGVRRQFLYDGDALVAEYSSSSSNTPLVRYVHGDQVDEPWVQYNGSGVDAAAEVFLHADQQGSVVALSDHSGNLITANSYDTYGIPSLDNEGRFGYTGQIWFKELGLNSYKARFYHPKLGRFLQTDPIFYEDQMNLYAYVHNDPISFSDPSGMDSVPFDEEVIVTGYRGDSGCGCQQLTGDAARAFIQDLQNARNNLMSVAIWRTTGIKTGMVAAISNVFNEEDSSQNEKKPKDAPSGTLDIDKAKKKYGWDKDKVHGIKTAAHGGAVNGKSWTGVAPDGTVGINEGGSWSPQGHWTDLL